MPVGIRAKSRAYIRYPHISVTGVIHPLSKRAQFVVKYLVTNRRRRWRGRSLFHDHSPVRPAGTENHGYQY
jgi:hypothetical protein